MQVYPGKDADLQEGTKLGKLVNNAKNVIQSHSHIFLAHFGLFSGH